MRSYGLEALLFFSFVAALLVFVLLGSIDDIRCWMFKKNPSTWVFNYRKELLYTQESSEKVQQTLLDWCEAKGSALSKSFSIKTPASFEITCWAYKQDNRASIQIDFVPDNTINAKAKGLFVYVTFITPKQFAGVSLYALDDMKLFLNEHTPFYRLI
jgi:hypothetical protein